MSVAIRTLTVVGYEEICGEVHDKLAGAYDRLTAIDAGELANLSAVQRVYYHSALRKLDLARADLDLILDPRLQQHSSDLPAQDVP